MKEWAEQFFLGQESIEDDSRQGWPLEKLALENIVFCHGGNIE